MTSNHLLRARRLLWVCGAALGLVIELTATSHGAFARTAPQFEALPLVRSRQNHLLLRAFINGRPAWLTVDSGAPVSAIALNRREHFRLETDHRRIKFACTRPNQRRIQQCGDRA